MDILTHTLSGLAAGTVVAGFSKKKLSGKAGIIAVSGVGGALPDLDTVSLWSKFDATIGKLLHLSHSGEVIYSGKFWYSHHGFLHSLAAAIIIAAITGMAGYLLKARCTSFKDYVGRQKAIFAGFISGFVIHLLEDMPTPSSTWGGVRLFWPLEPYVGGTGAIWWWNNYDLFLIAAVVFIAGAILILIQRLIRLKTKYLIAAIFASGCILYFVQIHSRDCDYAYTGHTDRYQQFEAGSKKQQREILGDRLYKAMEWSDNKLPVHF